MKYLFPALLCLLVVPALRADYALRDGDTVVFLGDSITAARVYGKVIENYTLLRFPARKVRFINAGWGGDTAAGGLARLERDVFAHNATVLIVAYGINDIGWGLKADREHKQKYLDAVRGIVERCRKRGVRVFICSAAVTGADPHRSEDDFLQKMCDEGLAVARAHGAGAIDVQRTMRDIQKRVWAANARTKDEKAKSSLHTADGVHLNELGQLAMAFAILKGLGAPAEVSAVTVDAAGPRLVEAKGCKVSGLRAPSGTVEFDRLDAGLPINFGLLGALNYRFIPIPDQLNRYLLAVRNLPAGRYEIVVDDRPVGVYSAGQLQAGVNISSATPDPWQPGGPWDAQATVLKHLTEARDEVAQGRLWAGKYLPKHPNEKEIQERAAKLNRELEALQRTVVRPVPYHFVIRPAAPK